MTDNCQNNQDKEKRIAELEALLAKQVAQNAQQEKKIVRQDRKIAKQDKKIAKQDKRLQLLEQQKALLQLQVEQDEASVKHVFIAGSNKKAAVFSGIDERAVIAKTYILSGFCAHTALEE